MASSEYRGPGAAYPDSYGYGATSSRGAAPSGYPSGAPAGNHPAPGQHGTAFEPQIHRREMRPAQPQVVRHGAPQPQGMPQPPYQPAPSQAAVAGHYREHHHHPAAAQRQIAQPRAAQPQHPAAERAPQRQVHGSVPSEHMGYHDAAPQMQVRGRPVQPRPQSAHGNVSQAGYAPAPQGHVAAPQGGWQDAPFEEDAGHAGAVARTMNGIGAVLSIALVAGLAVWGYKLAMRDVTEIPVVAALEGPMRVAPDDEGGSEAAHQGLAVNTVAATGSAEGPVNQVLLAPSPDGLTDEDVPAVAAALGSAPLETETGEAVVTPASVSGDEAERAAALAMAEQIANGATPLTGDAADLNLSDGGEALVDASAPGVAVSPRPRPRPEDIVARSAASPSTDALLAATSSAAAEVPASDIPVGTRLVQIGAYDSQDVARAEWDQLAGRFEDYMGGKSRVIEEASSGGKTFYRLRVMGFDDLSDARRFCAALMAGNANCIPVVTR
ncbi:SPOR domain-containing protein [uncultured Maritimibacter sp.]|uniref:SPOR domain-containing protein n=1 Tax=uncultured Maritimibacter sp. TaxID=991866 RepID=UPI000A68BE4F|nr:SPOR domain-containing protein [uncultured Maritimibacter sp.]